VSARDTARLLLAGVPTAREVDYHEWTATKPECRGELRAAGEVLWFTYAEDAPPVRELPTGPGAVVIGAASRRVFTRDQSGQWFYIDSSGHFFGTSGKLVDADWVPALVVPAVGSGPVTALRDILRDVLRGDVDRGTRLQAVEFAAREALKALDGEAG
jgi:hypothetical protein